MFRNSQKILISRHFLISLLFIILIFTSVGVSIDDVCASDLNQTSDEIKSELNVEDKLENSQENIVNSNNEVDDYLGASQESEILGKTITVTGNTFASIRKAIEDADDGDTIKLSGTYHAEKALDQIVLKKNIHFVGESQATLDGKGKTHIFDIDGSAADSSFKNIKFKNGYRTTVGAAMHIRASGITITNCVFENNKAKNGGAIATIENRYGSDNLKIENCKFIKNHASKSAGAVAAFGDNSQIINCVFDSNSVYNDLGDTTFGGALQIGLDDAVSRGYVKNCKFYNNYVRSDIEGSHGGAGCVRDGVVYENCIFENNSAPQGGALTYHASGIIKGCTFTGNSATYYGGALSTGRLYKKMNLNIVNCDFDGNFAPTGGAVQLNGENITLSKCDFARNNASKNGGAININAVTVNIKGSEFMRNIANVDGGAIFIKGKSVTIENSSFKYNEAIPDVEKLDDGLGGAIYINSTQANLNNNEFYYNTARNGSAIYYDKFGSSLKLENNVFYQNQAWVYLLPIYAHDIYYGETEKVGSVIHGGNNIGKYGNVAVSNAIYNAANNNLMELDGETPVLGATSNGHLYQDDREYNMDILLTVVYEDGTVVYNKTLNSDCFGEVSDNLENLKVGKYYVTAKHHEDTYYKAITNTTSFVVTAQVDDKVRKSASSDEINYDDLVIWTLNITNNGPSNATNVVVTDILPEGLEWIEDNTNGGYDPQTGILRIDTLNVGEVYIVTIVTKVKKTGNITNNVSVIADEYDYNVTNNNDHANINVNSACDLAVTKSVNASSVNLHDLVKWTITVSNNGPDTATGVIVSDLLPKSLIWVSDDSHGSYNHDSGEWNIGELNKGSTVRLNIVSRVNATGTIANYVSVSGNEFDWDTSNNFASKTVNVYDACDLGIVKSVSEGIVNYGDVVCWTLTVTNYGPDVASGVRIYDTLPDGFVYLNSTGNYSNGVVEIGDLAVGGSVSVKIYSRANITGSFVNVASVKGNEYDQNPKNNRDNVYLVVKPATDLIVTKDVNNTVPNFEDVVEWTITVKNNGPDNATGVTVIDLLPKSLKFIRSNGNYDNNTGKWNIGNLNKGSTAILKIICSVNATGVTENKVSVYGNEFDWDKSNNNASKIINVPEASDLGIVKSVSDGVVNYGDVVCWTLTVTNYGPDVASGVRIYDTLPDGFVFLNSTGNYSNGVVEIGDLAVGGSVSVKIYSRANITGSFVNVASVKGDEYDQNPKNNMDNVSLVVKPATDLIVTKAVSNSTPNFADEITWTITVKNNGPDNANGVVVTELLPKSLIWIDDSGLGKYNHITGIWDVGNVNRGEMKTLTIITKVNSTGIIENNVSVGGNEFDWNKSNNNDNKSINVANASDLSIIKLVNESVVNYHQLVKWTIIAINNGPDKATGVFVEDILPEGLQVINYTASKGFYDNGLWSVCCIENGESQTLELICFVNKTGNLTNFVNIGGNEYDPNMSNNENHSSVFVPKSSDLCIVKVVNNTNPNFGDIVEWTITVINNGPDDSDDVYVVDVLPDGLELLECYCSSGSYNDGMWHIPHLDNGDSESMVLRCLVNTLNDTENIATVIPSQYDWNESNNRDNASISVTPLADLSIVKLVNVSEANYLDLVRWTLFVFNYGPNDASGVFVSDVIPEGLTIVDVKGGNFEGSIWYIGDLANGESKKLEIICKIQATGSFTNVASVWGDQTDPELENNEDEKSLYVYPASDISITKTVSKYRYNLGEKVKYSIRLTNNGPDRAENVKVSEIMDDSLELVSFHASAGDFDKVNDVWSLDLLDAGRSAVLKVNAIATKAGSAKNKVVATNDNYDPDLSNNNDSVSVDIAEKEKSHNDSQTNNPKPADDEIVQSILLNNKAGNPIMVFILLFVFTMGALYGNSILKKR